ncbi:MAG: ERF family protein [Bacteroidota bacterium]
MTPAAMIQLAISQGQSLEQLERLLELQIRYEANCARKAYHDAMAKFKTDPPKIDKDRHVSFATAKGKTEYRHASLANVTEKINSALSAQGLSASWITDQEGDKIKVTCKITHILGHSETTSLSSAADTSGGKNMIQAIGSTVRLIMCFSLISRLLSPGS